MCSRGRALSVSEQEIADAKAIIGRDGVGCEPASATTVAGIKRLVAEGVFGKGETVVAVLTGHLLKDTDYVINYHRETLHTMDHLEGETEAEGRIRGTFGNHPVRVNATRDDILKTIEREQQQRYLQNQGE